MAEDLVAMRLDRVIAQQERGMVMIEDMHDSLTAMLAAMVEMGRIQQIQGDMLSGLVEAVDKEDGDSGEIVKLLIKLNGLVKGLDTTVLGLPRLVMDAVSLEIKGELSDLDPPLPENPFEPG